MLVLRTDQSLSRSAAPIDEFAVIHLSFCLLSLVCVRTFGIVCTSVFEQLRTHRFSLCARSSQAHQTLLANSFYARKSFSSADDSRSMLPFRRSQLIIYLNGLMTCYVRCTLNALQLYYIVTGAHPIPVRQQVAGRRLGSVHNF